MDNIVAVVQPDKLREQIAELNEKAAAPDLWDDPSAAQEVTSALSHRQSELDRITQMSERIDDLEAMVEMAAWTRRTLRRFCCACTCAGPSATDTPRR